jgi:calcium-dependent protein kinase
MGCGLMRQKAPKRETKLSGKRRLSELVQITGGCFLSKNQGKLSNHYKELKTIGSGAFAEVKLCEHLETSSIRAVKIIHKVGLHEQQHDSEFLLKEINVLTALDHPNIVRCYEIFEDQWKFFISMEYCEGGELFAKIAKLKKFNEKNAANVMSQLLSAVSHCHERLIIHRDLKPENILITENDSFSIKVADFGSSCFIDPDKLINGCFGSAYYVAPEVLLDEYNEKCDVWSCGVILFIMITGKPPYPGKDSKRILNLVKTAPLTITSEKMAGVSPACVDLLKKMLQVNPKLRITAKDAVNHEWIVNHKSMQDGCDLTGSLESLRNFHASVKLKDAVHVYLATHVISSEECRVLTQSFQSIDKNSDGKITRDELMEKYLEVMDEVTAREIVEKVMKEVDSDNSGDIQFSEFLSACMNYKKYLSRQNLEAAFKIFDIDHSGFITADEIMQVLGRDNKVPSAAWQEIIKEVDQNGDGVIDLKEFIELMTAKID